MKSKILDALRTIRASKNSFDEIQIFVEQDEFIHDVIEKLRKRGYKIEDRAVTLSIITNSRYVYADTSGNITISDRPLIWNPFNGL